jgi:hypothetical protein
MKLSNPAPGRPVTSPYGWRKHPISGVRKFHRGTDYGGTFDVLAAGDGVVVLKGANMNKRTGGGHTLVIKHNPDLFTLALGLRMFQGEASTSWNLLMAASLLSMLPVVILFFATQRHFIQGIVFTGVKA